MKFSLVLTTILLLLCVKTYAIDPQEIDIEEYVEGGFFTKSFKEESLGQLSNLLELKAKSRPELRENYRYNQNDIIENDLTESDSIRHIVYGRARFDGSTKTRKKKIEAIFHTPVFEGHLKIQSGNSENILNYRLIKNLTPGPRPLVIVFPPIMGATTVDNSVAKQLAKNGAHVVHIELQDLFTKPRPLNELQAKFHALLLSSKILIENLGASQDLLIDENKIGVFGVSLGGIVGATLAGITDKIKSAYLLGAGGNLSYISQNSTRDSVSQLKDFIHSQDEKFKELDLANNDNTWMKYSAPYFEVLDPLSFTDQLKNKKVFMLMSSEDTTVPFVTQFELWEALDRPEHMLFSMSHISMIVRWFLEKRNHVVDFFIN